MTASPIRSKETPEGEEFTGSPQEAEPPKPTPRSTKKMENIQINVGADAIQEKQYKFKKNIVKTTK